MTAAMAVISAARLSDRTEAKSRNASPTEANALRLVVRCSERKPISTSTSFDRKRGVALRQELLPEVIAGNYYIRSGISDEPTRFALG